MQRITITVDDDLLASVDRSMRRRGYTSRSEAFRDIVRELADLEDGGDPEAPCIATLSHVFDHTTRDLGSRLMHADHHHHDLSSPACTCISTATLVRKYRCFAATQALSPLTPY